MQSNTDIRKTILSERREDGEIVSQPTSKYFLSDVDLQTSLQYEAAGKAAFDLTHLMEQSGEARGHMTLLHIVSLKQQLVALTAGSEKLQVLSTAKKQDDRVATPMLLSECETPVRNFVRILNLQIDKRWLGGEKVSSSLAVPVLRLSSGS